MSSVIPPLILSITTAAPLPLLSPRVMHVLFQLLQHHYSPLAEKIYHDLIHFIWLLKYSSIYWFIFSDYSNVTFYIPFVLLGSPESWSQSPSYECLLSVLRYLVMLCRKNKVVIKSMKSASLRIFNPNNLFDKLFHPLCTLVSSSGKDKFYRTHRSLSFGLNGSRHR